MKKHYISTSSEKTQGAAPLRRHWQYRTVLNYWTRL